MVFDCCSVTQSCLTLWDPMDCSTFARCPSPSTRVCLVCLVCLVHCISDAVQPCHPLTISFCLQTFPASETFLMSYLFTSDDQNTGASASSSVLPVNIQGWSPLRLTGLISLLSKGLSGIFSSTIIWRHQFFSLLSFSL